MHNYLVRFEAASKSDKVLEQIRATASDLGLVRTTLGADGSAYELPGDMYTYATDQSLSDTRDKLRETLDAINPDTRVLVIDAKAMSWSLPKSSE